MEDKKRKKVMIVEDDSFVVDIYNTKISESGFDVVVCNNGREALKKIEEEKPDLILLDVLMPYIDGLEFLKIIRQKEKFKDVHVILLTNLSQKEEVDRGIELGADDYLIKSHFTPSEVLEKIKKYL